MTEYKYSEVPLTPSMIEEITIKLFNGQTIERKEIAKKVLNYHKENGGLSPVAKDFPRSVKKALENMSEKEWVTNPAYGYWSVDKDDVSVVEKTIIDEEEMVEIEEIPAYTVYGKGTGFVYLYYFDTYKKLALLQGNETWACKIGRSDIDPLSRIYSQVSTALSEPPTIEYVIKTNDSSLLEGMLHSVLKVRKKQINNSPGSEWFYTNPDEIIKIIEFINKDILDS